LHAPESRVSSSSIVEAVRMDNLGYGELGITRPATRPAATDKKLTEIHSLTGGMKCQGH
jgi:hypothetical protein